MINNLKGYIHSIESLGALDGPGLRSVIFFQGCPLRCKFCHNIDSAIENTNAKKYSATDLFEKVERNKAYWKKNGGITISGGDPIFQPKFLIEFVNIVKRNDIHLALDTSLYTSKEVIDKLIEKVDLWMISLKHMDDRKHKDLTGRSNKKILENILYLDEQIKAKNKKAKIRIRFVVIPEITDSEEHLKDLILFIKKIKNFECLELLAYNDLGKFKWIEIFGKYDLEGVRPASKKNLETSREFIDSIYPGLEIKY